MSIRSRLVVLCAIIALLPAIPLSYLVRSLLEKSFTLGLNPSVEQALQDGVAVSREHLAGLHVAFERDVAAVLEWLPGSGADSASVALALSMTPKPFRTIDGFVLAGGVASLEDIRGIQSLIGSSRIVARSTAPDRSTEPDRPTGVQFFDTEDRGYQFALWEPGKGAAVDAARGDGATPSGRGRTVCFYNRVDPAFLDRANELLASLQLFTQLRLTEPALSSSFFYPFIIIYAIILCLSLVFALVMAERISKPVRRLSAGAEIVADGDWSHRVHARAGGELGRLVERFNWMVSRLETQQRRLLDMEKMATWRDMARHLAHEIKNPLLPIKLTVQELRDQYTGGDDRYRALVDDSARIVEDELSHLQNLVKEFSQFARMPDLAPRPGSLPALVSDVAKLYAKIPVTVAAGKAFGDFAFDPDQLRRAFVNLMDNAVSALEHTAEPRIRVSIDRRADEVIVAFSDNGPGIPPEHREKIFEPYYSMRSGGSGLGLAIVKNIVLLHGGSIRAEGNEWGGATFVMILPIRQAPGKERALERS
jgi:nitrogen fixation/metabolism regulation signal transduction histidine kinase